jgi:anti-sigma factor RsiW
MMIASPLSRRKLSCRELVELVTQYLEGGLSRRERGRFEAHIADCGNCTRYLQQFRETIRLTGTLRESDLSSEAAATLLAQFEAWRAGD